MHSMQMLYCTEIARISTQRTCFWECSPCLLSFSSSDDELLHSFSGISTGPLEIVEYVSYAYEHRQAWGKACQRQVHMVLLARAKH